MVGINKNIFGKNSIKEEKRVKYGISIKVVAHWEAPP